MRVQPQTELDLQHEINAIIGEVTYEEYEVSFDVKAQYVTDDRIKESQTAARSSPLEISSAGKTPLKTPTNLVLNDDCTGSWEYDEKR